MRKTFGRFEAGLWRHTCQMIRLVPLDELSANRNLTLTKREREREREGGREGEREKGRA